MATSKGTVAYWTLTSVANRAGLGIAGRGPGVEVITSPDKLAQPGAVGYWVVAASIGRQQPWRGHVDSR